MRPITEQQWEELLHAIITRDSQWGPSLHDKEPSEDHVAHLTKMVNDMAHITYAEISFHDQGRYQQRTVCAFWNMITTK
jgi:hypothetical protein